MFCRIILVAPDTLLQDYFCFTAYLSCLLSSLVLILQIFLCACFPVPCLDSYTTSPYLSFCGCLLFILSGIIVLTKAYVQSVTCYTCFYALVQGKLWWVSLGQLPGAHQSTLLIPPPLLVGGENTMKKLMDQHKNKETCLTNYCHG